MNLVVEELFGTPVADHRIEVVEHMTCTVVLEPGSEELTGLFARPEGILSANDTSATVGYWPLSPTEETVLKLENFLNSTDFKKEFPETGEDIKVMGVRRNGFLDLTVAMPLLARFIPSERDYFVRKEVILKRMRQFVSWSSSFRDAEVHLNTHQAETVRHQGDHSRNRHPAEDDRQPGRNNNSREKKKNSRRSISGKIRVMSRLLFTKQKQNLRNRRTPFFSTSLKHSSQIRTQRFTKGDSELSVEPSRRSSPR